MNFRQHAKLPMKTTIALLTIFFCQASQESSAQNIPRTVTETWADYDPRAEPLEVEVVREESDGGIITRYVRYVVGTLCRKEDQGRGLLCLSRKSQSLARNHPGSRWRSVRPQTISAVLRGPWLRRDRGELGRESHRSSG